MAGRTRQTAHPVDVLLGVRLRKLRKKHRVTQQTVGRCLGVTSQQVAKYETGANRLTVAQLYSLSKLFQLPVVKFFAGNEKADLADVTERAIEAALFLQWVQSLPRQQREHFRLLVMAMTGSVWSE